MLNVNKIINTKTLEEYNNKEQSKTKCYHVILISIFSLIIAIMIAFIIVFKYQMFTIKNKSLSLSSAILAKSNKTKELNVINNKMLLNLNGLFKNNLDLQLNNFKSVDEFNLIRRWAGEKNKITVCYKGTYDKDNENAFETYCTNRSWLAFVFKTESRRRFGAIIFTSIYKMNEYHSDSRAFLFSLDDSQKRMFKINNPDKAFMYHRNNDDNTLFHFGEDLIIAKDYLNNKNSKAQFPIDFGTQSHKLNDLTGGESSFRIIELEILSDVNYMD